MRDIEYLIVHATMSRPDISARQIDEYFTRSKRLKGVGLQKGRYHVMVERSGLPVRLYEDGEETLGMKAFEVLLGDAAISVTNNNTCHLAWIGGLNARNLVEDNRTEDQKAGLLAVINQFLSTYPGMKVLGYNQVNEREESPVFFVPEFLSSNSVPVGNIYSADNFYFQSRVRRQLDTLYYDADNLPGATKRYYQDLSLSAGQWQIVQHNFGVSDGRDVLVRFSVEGREAVLEWEPVDMNLCRVRAGEDVDVRLVMLAVT